MNHDSHVFIIIFFFFNLHTDRAPVPVDVNSMEYIMWHKIMQYRDQPQECILLFISLSGCNTIFPGCSLPKSNQLTIDLSGADTVSAVVCHSNEPETESGCSLSHSLSLSCTSSVFYPVFFFWHTPTVDIRAFQDIDCPKHSEHFHCHHIITFQRCAVVF